MHHNAQPPGHLSPVIDGRVMTRREKQRVARREALINAALTLFAKKGFAATRMEEIAKKAKVAKGTLYLYFDNKEALFQAVILAKMLPVVEHVEGMAVSLKEVSCAELIRRQLQVVYDSLVDSDRRQIMRLIIAEGPHFPNLAKFYYENLIARGVQSMRATLQLGMERGEFRKMDHDELPIVLMAPAIVLGLWKSVFETHHPIKSKDYLNAHMDVLLGSLKR